MQINKSKVIIFVLAMVLITGLNANAYKKVKVFMPQTPEINLEDAKTIAVMDFNPISPGSKQTGKVLADMMIEYFLMDDRGIHSVSGGFLKKNVEGTSLIQGLSTKCFTVMERSRLEAVLDEQSMSDMGLVDDAKAAQIGQLLGVDVMIYGEISTSQEDQKTTETKTYNKKKVRVNCTVRKVSVSGNVRIVDARTGEIIGTKRLTKKTSDKSCSGGSKTLRDVNEMVSLCANAMAWEFVNLVNPWYELDKFELEKIKINEFKKEADVAAKAAEKLELDRAYAIYNKLFEADSYNPKFLYNMGVLFEVTGDFEQASAMYQGAAMLKDEKKYKEAVERIARRVELIPFYAYHDMEIVQFDFEEAASNSSLMAEKVEVKGSSKDRIAVYAESNSSSDVQAKVPGGVQFEIIEQEGDWYRVRLLGGKQGYLHKDQVK